MNAPLVKKMEKIYKKKMDEKVRKLARYGLGCAIFRLKGKELLDYYDFCTGKRIDGIFELMKKALPDAYPQALKNCKEYFFGIHNENLKAEFSEKPALLNFCLARVGDLLEKKKVHELDDPHGIKFYLESPISEKIDKIGVIKVNGKKELGILLIDADVGEKVIIHRNVICDKP